MAIKIYDAAEDNGAYMQGYVAGRKATGEDWVQARLREDDQKAQKEKAWSEMTVLADAAKHCMKVLEEERDYWKSLALAYQVALQSVVSEDLRARRV